MELDNISIPMFLRAFVLSLPNCFTVSCECRVKNERRISWSEISTEPMDSEDFFSVGVRERLYIYP